MDKKLQVYHFHNGSGGGVLSVIRNLLRFSNNPSIENHVIFTINKDVKPVYTVEHIEGANSQQIFYYSSKWNFYYTCRQLAKLLPDDKAIVVAHDWLELGMMSNLGLQNPVVQFVHGAYDYYYQLAKSHQSSIDLFIAVAQNIEKALLQLIDNSQRDIIYLRFPVPSVNNLKKEIGDDINIIFIGRLEHTKGYELLPAIAKKINEKNKNVHWHIVGSSADDNATNIFWDENIQVKFYGSIQNSEVLELLKNMQILLLPSLAEGMPVIIVEAMKAGVIPIVNNIDGGIQELVIDNETGYKIRSNAIDNYVKAIISLITDKVHAIKMSHKSMSLANELFDPVINTRAIEEKLIEFFYAKRRMKGPVKIYGSRLDQPWLGNIFTYTLRKKFK